MGKGEHGRPGGRPSSSCFKWLLGMHRRLAVTVFNVVPNYLERVHTDILATATHKLSKSKHHHNMTDSFASLTHWENRYIGGLRLLVLQ